MLKINNHLSLQSPFSALPKSSQPSHLNLSVDKLEGLKRHVSAQVQIPYSSEQVWQIISDYEAFSEFIPTIAQSNRLEHPTGGIRIEEVRARKIAGMSFSARAIFDITEKYPHEINYQLVEGDMEEFSGYWRLKPVKFSELGTMTDLTFDFLVIPKPRLPMVLIDRALSHIISANLFAIYQRIAGTFGPR